MWVCADDDQNRAIVRVSLTTLLSHAHDNMGRVCGEHYNTEIEENLIFVTYRT